MPGKTVTRLDLAEAVAREGGVTKQQSIKLLDDVLNAMMAALVEEGEIKISGFATWTVRSKKARVGRNPRTGEERPITARKVIGFRPSPQVKVRVASGNKG